MLKAFRRVALAVVVPAVATVSALIGSTPAQAITVTRSMATMESQVVSLTNQYRTKFYHCSALHTDSRLTAAARYYSLDMSTRRFFSHVSPSGSTFVTRTRAAGYRYPSAENIAWGYRSAYDLVTAWMRSPEHRRNIVNCSSHAVGIGVQYRADGTPFWTQEFGRV